MRDGLSVQRFGIIIALACAGLILAWLTKDPLGLIAAAAVVCIYCGILLGLVSVALFSIGFGLCLILQGRGIAAEPETYLRLATFLGAGIFFLLFLRDFRAESAQRKAERETRMIVEKMPGFGFSQDAEGRFRYVDPMALDYHGVTFEEMDQIDEDGHFGWERLVHPDDLDNVLQGDVRHPEIGTTREFEARLLGRDGTYRWFRGVGCAEVDRNGNVTGRYGTYIDIEDLKDTQAALREREQQLRQLIDTVSSLIWCMTAEGETTYINKRLEEYIGLGIEDLDRPNSTRLDNAILAVAYPDDRAAVETSLRQSFATGEPFHRKYRMRRADGTYRWIDGRAYPLRDDEGNVVQWYGVCLDIEDETRMQQALRSARDQLARASQAASLAELSASIAHEVNQPLAAIVTHSDACQRWLLADPPNLRRARRTLERIVVSASSAADVVERVRSLYRQTDRARAPANINDVLGEVCELMAEEAVKKNVRIETELQSGLPIPLIDRVQIQQVLANLMRNGIDAMELVPGDRRLLRIRSLQSSRNALRIEVQDSGSGLEEPERAFDPFYTTKDKGMGMGLAICRSIIESHDGQLSAVKNDLHGTTFTFTIPIQLSVPMQESVRDTAPSPAAAGIAT